MAISVALKVPWLAVDMQQRGPWTGYTHVAVCKMETLLKKLIWAVLQMLGISLIPCHGVLFLKNGLIHYQVYRSC